LALPAGKLFATGDIDILHAISVLPIAYALAALIRRGFRQSSISFLASAIWLVVVAISFRPDGSLGTFDWSADWGVVARATLRSSVSLLVLLPGAWFLQLIAAPWLGSVRRTGGEPSDPMLPTTKTGASLWAACAIAFAVALPCWGYKSPLQRIAAMRSDYLTKGYIVEAQRVDERLAVIAGEGYRDLVPSWVADRLAELRQHAANPGQDIASVVTRAQALIALAKYDQAERLLIRLWKSTGEPAALRELGNIEAMRGNLVLAYTRFSEEAHVLRTRADELPDHKSINEWLASALLAQAQISLRLDDPLDALRLSRESVDVAETSDGHLTMVRTLNLLHRAREAQVHIDRFVELEPRRKDEVFRMRQELAEKALDCAVLSPAWQ